MAQIVIALCFVILTTQLHFSSSQQLCLKSTNDERCVKECVTTADCRGSLKTCNCDGVCGMSCFNLDLNCTEDLTLENGNVRPDGYRKYGEYKLFRCNDGYVMNGADTRTCQSNKQYSGTNPTCVRGCKTAKSPDSNSNNGVNYKTGYPVGAKFNYVCNPGYEMTGTSETTCQADFTWSVPVFTCTPLNCGPPREPNYGYSKQIEGAVENQFASKIEFFCNEGYTLSGSRYSWCETDGQWTDSVPTCTIVECPTPPEIAHGVMKSAVQSSYEYGNVVLYQCNIKYKLVGSDRALCSSTKKWTNVPQCTFDPDCNFDQYLNRPCAYESSPTPWDYVPKISFRGFQTYTARGNSKSSPLMSSPITLSKTQYCLTFNYLPNTEDAMKFYTLKNNNEKEMALLGKINVDTWNNMEVALTPTTTGIPEKSPGVWNVTLQWLFKVTNDQSTVYIDDIRLLNRTCTKMLTTTTQGTVTTTINSSAPPDISTAQVSFYVESTILTVFAAGSTSTKSTTTKIVETTKNRIDPRNIETEKEQGTSRIESSFTDQDDSQDFLDTYSYSDTSEKANEYWWNNNDVEDYLFGDGKEIEDDSYSQEGSYSHNYGENKKLDLTSGHVYKDTNAEAGRQIYPPNSNYNQEETKIMRPGNRNVLRKRIRPNTQGIPGATNSVQSTTPVTGLTPKSATVTTSSVVVSSESSETTLSPGAIAGIVIGSLVVVVAIVLLLYFLVFKGRRKPDIPSTEREMKPLNRETPAS